MRPNFFVNTPDINPVLSCRRAAAPASGSASCWRRRSAATTASTAALSCARRRRSRARRNTLDSEKYQLQGLGLGRPGNIRDDIRRINRAAARASPALQQFANLDVLQRLERQHPLLRQERRPTAADFLLFAVNLDPHNAAGAPTSRCRCGSSACADDASIEVEDLLTRRTASPGPARCSTCCLDPREQPYMIWRLFAPETPMSSSLRQSVQALASRSRPRQDTRRSSAATRLVQGRHHLPAAHQGLPRRQRRRLRRFRGPDRSSSTTSQQLGVTASGCCRSIPRRCATTATTSPTIPRVHPAYGDARRTSSASSTPRTSAAFASSPSW